MFNSRNFILDEKDNIEDYISTLVNFLNYHTKLYDQGTPEISDYEWDEKYYELVKLENETGFYLPNSPTQKVVYNIVNNLNKIKHNHEMLSLAKTKDWNEFLLYFHNIDSSKSVIGMPKLDGLTCSLKYIDGILVSAETRGDGIIGEDILHNAKVVKSIPKKINYKKELIIDGEIICTTYNFENFKEEYANPRNFASGSIRLLNPKECEKRNLTFVAWNVIKGFQETNSFMQKLVELQCLGFVVTPWTSGFDWDAKEFLVDKAEKKGFPIDGLVGRFDDIEFGESLGATGHHSRAAYAFKFYDEEVETELLDIEWSLGKTGILTPIAKFKQINLEGTQVERASLHNLSVAQETLNTSNNVCGWKGQKVYITKRNQIIPQVEWAEEDNEYVKFYFEVPHYCPICGNVLEIKDNNGIKNVICPNDNCQGKLINKLDSFCGRNGLNIKGLSKATLEKLINWGWVNNYEDIFELFNHKDEWEKKEGFGKKSVENILIAITKSCDSDLPHFLTAINIPLISLETAKEICKNVKSYNELREKVINGFDFTEWKGFGEEKAKSLKNFDYTEADIIINRYISIKTIKEENNNKLNNLTFVITGNLNNYKNRTELKNIIESFGGKVTSSISSNTDYLINNNINSTSSKNKAAKTNGIPIITEKDFIEKFLT